MPDVRPFRGVRYDMAQVGALSDVVAPPYDVIDAALQERLYQASPYNIIRLELNRPGAGRLGDGRTATPRGRGFLRDWLREGVLRTDDHPALYLYEQTFEVEGQTHHPQGVPRPGPAGAVRPGTDLPPRADPGRPQGRPAGALPGDGLQPQPDLRALSRRRRTRCSGRRGGPARPHAAGGGRPPGRGQPALAR